MRRTQLLAVTLVVGTILLGAPAHLTASPDRVVTAVRAGIDVGGLAFPIVDPVLHRVYGVDNRGIRDFDEITGQARWVLRIDKRNEIVGMALDVTGHRVLAEETHFVRTIGKAPNQTARDSVFADVIDTESFREIAQVPLGRTSLSLLLYLQGSATVDTIAHHGLVTDFAGRGVSVDLHDGRVLARPATGVSEAGSVFSFTPFAGSAVISSLHRIAVVVDAPRPFVPKCGSCLPWLTLVDSSSGRIIRRVAQGEIYAESVTADPRRGWFVVFGGNGLQVVDARTCKLVRRVPFGIESQGIGIDAATDNAFMLDTVISPTNGEERWKPLPSCDPNRRVKRRRQERA